MNKVFKTTLLLLIIMGHAAFVNAQEMKMGEVIIISTSAIKPGIGQEQFKLYIHELMRIRGHEKTGTGLHLFRADRGNKNGELLLVYEADNTLERKSLPVNSPFTQKPAANSESKLSDFLTDPGAYVEYHLIGTDQFKPLPSAGILGVHKIQVQPEKAEAFEKFVQEKLNPTAGHLLPDIHLMYYKAVAGSEGYKNEGVYMLIFAIESVAARDKYWPAGAPETEALKQAFSPLNDLAVELSSYLVEGSYLEPGKGAAAYFESLQWTDFIHQ